MGMKVNIKGKDYTLLSNFGSVETMRGFRRNVVRLDFDCNESEFKEMGWEDNVIWKIIEEIPAAEDIEKGMTRLEYDQSDYCLVCDYIVHYDGKISLYMGQYTNEELYEKMVEDLLLGGI